MMMVMIAMMVKMIMKILYEHLSNTVPILVQADVLLVEDLKYVIHCHHPYLLNIILILITIIKSFI